MNVFNKTFAKANLLNEKQLKTYLKGYQFSEIHCIEIIKNCKKINIDVNVTRLSEQLNMTRGGVSKLTKKLINNGDIESYQNVVNKKEVFFKLTKQGEAMSKRHDNLHQLWEEREKVISSMVSEDEKEIIINFLEKFNTHIDNELLKLDSLENNLER